jgi:NADH:ubiquinone oxidoreductase subunit E
VPGVSDREDCVGHVILSHKPANSPDQGTTADGQVTKLTVRCSGGPCGLGPARIVSRHLHGWRAEGVLDPLAEQLRARMG